MTARQVTVLPEGDGMRLDRWLREQCGGLSQARIARLLRCGRIRVDGGRARVGRRLSAGERVRIPPDVQAAGSSVCGHEVRLADRDRRWLGRAALLHRDKHVLAINKPAGIPVQGGTGTDPGRSLDSMVSAWIGGDGFRPRLVHRLDRETSGVLLMALDRPTAAALAASFRDRMIGKLYWAAVRGRLSPPSGKWAGALIREAGGGVWRTRIARETETGGKPASTEYVTAAVNDEHGVSWILLRPHTGRMHQIRAHLAAAGAPILGDRRYGVVDAGRGARLCLHARAMDFLHPTTGARIELTAPLDEAMQEIWRVFGWRETDPPADPFRSA